MADISKIILPDNSEYDLKDANAFHASDNIPRTSVGLSTDQVSKGVDNVSRSMIGMVRSNKTFGLPANQITVEYSRDGGATWTDYGLTNDEKRSLFAETRTVQIHPGKNTTAANNSLNNQVRVTITHFDRYVSLDSVYLWSGKSGSWWCVDLDASTIGSPTEFTNIFTGHELNGWPGSSIRYFPILSFGGFDGALKSENYHSLRLTFRLTVVGSGVPYVSDIRFYGLEAWKVPNNMVGTDHLYSWDLNLTAQFPNSVIGGNDSDTSTRSVTAKSKSGVLSLKSNGNTSGSGTRTLTADAHGSGSSKNIVVVDTNNIVSLNTDNLTISGKGTTSQDVPAKLSFSVTDTTLSNTISNAYIAAYHDHERNGYGTNMVLHSGGNIFLGSGEAPSNHYELYKNSQSENTYITADGNVHIQANGQTIGNRSGMQLTNQGALIPERADVATDNVGSIGTSTYKWNHVYTTNLNGVAVGDNPKFTDTTYSVATTTTDGLMSSTDKSKLDGIGIIPTKTSDLQNDSGFVTGPIPTKTSELTNDSGFITGTLPTKTSDLTNDSGFITGMTILSYGNSTWADFIEAYSANKVVYCRASSNANPATGSQTRLAFMAYVNNGNQPTNVEFQYYRSVNAHSATQQGDQVYVYKLDKNSGWTVTVRESYTRIVAGTGISSSYSSSAGTLTLNLNSTIPSSASDVGAIAAPSSANSGDFLVYNGTNWVAQSLSTWQGGNY